MKSGIITMMLFAATLACGAGSVQAAPPPDPLGMIVAESMSNYCHGGDWMIVEHSRAGEHPGPQMGPPHGRNPVAGLPGPQGPPHSMRTTAGDDERPPALTPRENIEPCPMKIPVLADAQKKQIAAIILEERDKALPILKKREEVREKLRQAERAATFDEKAVRAMWKNAAQLDADMMVSRVSARNRISAVLTPAQRDLVKKMESGMGRDAARQGIHE